MATKPSTDGETLIPAAPPPVEPPREAPMASGDAVATVPTVPTVLTGEQVLELVRLLQGNQIDQAKAQAEIIKSTLKPDNPRHPGISVYNPQGERDHPNPPFVTRFFLSAYEIEHSSVTTDEIRLLNQIAPGDYWVTQTDGTRVRVPVVGAPLPTGDGWERLEIRIPMSNKDREQAQRYPSLTAILTEILAQRPPSAAA